MSVLFTLGLLGCPAIPTDSPDPVDTADSAPGPVDADGDGATTDMDCDDDNPEIHPGAVDGCNGIDDDCDGSTDEDPDLSWHPDTDEDGYGATGDAVAACVAPVGYAAGGSDCDDANDATWPGADEVCDDLDNDCDGEIDEGLPRDIAFWIDNDGDGAGDPASLQFACAAPTAAGAVDNGLDCDDADAATPVWVVHGAGAGSGSFADPFHKIADALRARVSCVLVGPGTYSEDVTWPGADVWVRSVEGADVTGFSGTGTAPVLTVTGGSTTASILEGFTISGGGGDQQTSSNTVGSTTYYYTKYFGGGVYVGPKSAITLVDSVIDSNELATYEDTSSGSLRYITASYGGGVYLDEGELVMDGGSIESNYAHNGGAVYNDAGVFGATGVWIGANKAYSWASVYADHGSLVSLQNVIVNANLPSSSPGGLSIYESTLVLDHTDVVSEDYGVLARGSAVAVSSSIFAGNAYAVQGSTSTFSATYTAFDSDSANFVGVSDPTGTSGNVATDCGFTTYRDDTNATNDDLTLAAGSPCADVGPPAEKDVDGSASDLGAYGGPAGSW